jgi:hypothetical protein
VNPIRFMRQIHLHLVCLLLEAEAIRDDYRFDALLWAKGVVERCSFDSLVLFVARHLNFDRAGAAGSAAFVAVKWTV